MANNSKDQTSTLQSVVDQASAAISSGIGALTGNPADKREAETKRATADAEHDLSHAAAKAGPFTVTPSGAAKDNPDRSAGSWNQTVGSAKEAVGGLVGAEGLRQEGMRQNEEGKAQEAQGQVKDLGKGLGDRVGGAIGGAVAGLTGNAAQQSEAQRQHDEGKARQRGVEADLQKQAQNDPNFKA